MQDQVFSLVPPASSLADLIEKAKTFVASAKAPATLSSSPRYTEAKAYRNDWRDFESWCQSHRLPSLPSTPQTVPLYIADRASTLATGTITRRLTSITKAHRAAGYNNSPATTKHFIVGETLAGIRRLLGTAPNGKNALLADDIRGIIAACPESMLGARDRALVLVGFAGTFRRSELARIEVGDLTSNQDGVVIDLRRSKTDQEGAGRQVGLPFGVSEETCPVRTLQNWLCIAGIAAGPVFRYVDRYGQVAEHGLNRDSIGRLLKRAAARAGMKVDRLGGHSLRAGHVTQAARNGVSERVIMQQTGHKTVAALRRYIRKGEIFRENAAAGLGI